jgi:hypothetical protein
MPALRTRDTLPRRESSFPPSLCFLFQTNSLPLTAFELNQPPMLTQIIAPTPRAFEFPSAHNLKDSPLNTPSCSPFEPERRMSSLPSLACPSPSATSATLPLQKRRRATSCDGDERRSKRGDEDYIKRPENAFILFRRKCCEDRLRAGEDSAVTATSEGTSKKLRQADLSKTISAQWKSLSSEDRQYWENLAKEKKKEHERLHPNYQYQPQRAKDREARWRNLRVRGEAKTTEHESSSFVSPGPPRSNRRSSSVPISPPIPRSYLENI